VASAKDIVLKPILGKDANRLIAQWHYSHTVVPNSQVHLGAFLNGRCGGVLQFGPPMMRRQVLGLVRGTAWSEMIELNRLAFADWMPRNGESRCLAVAMRILRKQYPALKWVLSFADGVQCGDGTIYRAAGFVLTAIRRSKQILELADGRRVTRFALSKNVATMPNGRASTNIGKPLAGYMFRYVYFLQPAARAQLTVPEVPYSKIAELGVGMYRGQRVGGVASIGGDQPSGDGPSPIPALQS
jgi:hypothetical protein